MTYDVQKLVFVGFNSQVAALDRDTGELVWKWTASTPWSRNYVSLLLLDSERLIASINGYTYGLDPATGTQLWYNPLHGFGTGVVSLAAWGAASSQPPLLAAAEEAAHAAASSAATTSTMSAGTM